MKPRNGHPSWCVRDGESQIGRHVSAQVRAGVRRNGGEATAWLTSMGGGPARLHLSVAHMAWAQIDLSLLEASELRDGLTKLLRAAGYE